MTEKTENKNSSPKTLLSWEAPEYVKHEKGIIWATIAISITAALIAYAILSGAWTMALAFFTLAIVYYLQQKNNPQDITIEITDMGLKIAGRLYQWSSIKAFWIVYDPPFVTTLHIRFVKKSQADIVVQFAGQDPVVIREHLLRQIPEWEGKEEAAIDALIRAFKL